MVKIIAVMCLLSAGPEIFAQEDDLKAVILELTGTVELQQKGSAVWGKAVQGQAIVPDTIISTGFKSSAIIGVGDSVISVRPLTRLSFREIKAGSGTETINVSLQAGRVRADVKQPSGTKSSFGVHSPVATASTRGTIFEVSVYELRVIEGTIEYQSVSAAPILVDAVGYSYINEKTGRAIQPVAAQNAAVNPDLPIGNDAFYSFEIGAGQNIQNVEVKAKITYN